MEKRELDSETILTRPKIKESVLLSQEKFILKMASVAVRIRCMGPLGWKEGNFALSYRSLSAQHFTSLR
jgi:hypothetical protein